MNGLAWNFIKADPIAIPTTPTSSTGFLDSLGSRFQRLGEQAQAVEHNRALEAQLQAIGRVQANQAQLVYDDRPKIIDTSPTGLVNQSVTKPNVVEGLSQVATTTPVSVPTSIPKVKGLSTQTIQAATPYMDMFKTTSEKYGVPLPILLGIAQQESDFRVNPGNNPNSSAKGMMQFVDSTWKKYGQGKDRLDPMASIDAAGRLLADNYKASKNWQHAIGMYHTGNAAISGNLNNNWGVFANNPAVQKESRHYWNTVPQRANLWAQYLGMKNIF